MHSFDYVCVYTHFIYKMRTFLGSEGILVSPHKKGRFEVWNLDVMAWARSWGGYSVNESPYKDSSATMSVK